MAKDSTAPAYIDPSTSSLPSVKEILDEKIKQEKEKKKGKKEGRRWFDGKYTEEQVLSKLEEAAALDASLGETLYYADISQSSYYRYLEANPKFRERLQKLRERPILLARQTVVKKMVDSYGNAIDYLRRKKRDEFGDSIDVTTKGESMNEYKSMTSDELRARRNRSRANNKGAGK